MKKILISTASLAMLAATLTACGSDTKETTVVHDRPVVVQTPASGNGCAHGYDNIAQSCY